MGIRGLESFLEKKCPSACYPVDIKKLIDEFKRETGQEDVVIAVDGTVSLRLLYQGFVTGCGGLDELLDGTEQRINDSLDSSECNGGLDWVLGGQLKEYAQRIKDFVQSFELLGVRLVFFFKGTSVDRNVHSWNKVRAEALDRIEETLDRTKNGEFLSEGDYKRLFYLPGGIASTGSLIFKHECGCDIRLSQNECKENSNTIAKFARSNNCFAILSQDTNFVIHEGAEHYLSLKNLNLDTMTTLCYNRSALANYLQISPSHLPLWASLCGNDIMFGEDLENFHERECGPPPRPQHRYGSRPVNAYIPFPMILHSVAHYIRRRRFGEDLGPHLETIARDVYRDVEKRTLVAESLDCYSSKPRGQPVEQSGPQSNWSRILARSRRLHQCGEMVEVYGIVTNRTYKFGLTFENIRWTDLPAAADLTLTLRRRIYGVLLREADGAAGTVADTCVKGTDQGAWEASVVPLPPPEGMHPGLLALWDFEDRTWDRHRWSLFAAGASPTLDPDTLRALPARLVVPAAVLLYMRCGIPRRAADARAAGGSGDETTEAAFLEDWELEALMVQAVRLASTDPSAISVSKPYAIRAIRLGAIFTRCAGLMIILLGATGYPIPVKQALPVQYFDGKLLQQTYKQLAAGGGCESAFAKPAEESMWNEFQQLRRVVLPESTPAIVQI